MADNSNSNSNSNSSQTNTKDYATLTPSQALAGRPSANGNRRRKTKPSPTMNQPTNNANANANGEAVGSSNPPQQQQQQPKQGNRKRRPGKDAKVGAEVQKDSASNQIQQDKEGGDRNNDAEQPKDGTNGNKNRRRNRGRGKINNKVDAAGEPLSVGEEGATSMVVEGANDSQPTAQGQPGTTQGNKKANKRKNNKNNKKKYPWRRFISAGTVDPITLESLTSLDYPPFALVANAPYDPVPVWPIPEKGSEEETNNDRAVDIEELNRKRIAEQWGKSFGNGDGNGNAQDPKPAPPLDLSKRHYNLYDGRALAYYIVSQLQFIDPLNRRDLTREELLNLDAYLRRHGFKDLNVTEAYDAKGVTISSAGAAAATAQGRADIMQQMARNLLNSLFGGHSVAAPVPTRRQEQSPLQEQYAALQRQEAAHRRRPRQTEQRSSGSLNPNAMPFAADFGVYTSEDGGLMVIDDDENPGMRGGDYAASSRGSRPRSGPAATATNPFYSASHIAARHGSGGIASNANADAFPALAPARAAPTPAAPVATAPASSSNTNKPLAKPSKTLARITGAVKKTDPEELQRQWEAREEARRRAMMANMSFGVDASILNATQQGLLQAPPGIGLSAAAAASSDVSDEKLQRNRAFADALGVQPATIRQTINSGWARPTDVEIRSLDEFGNELNAAIYPDPLLSQARDRMGLLLKMERKWKAFLKDDKAASLPLNPMDKPSRIFVHHYSDFWNLKTESFDPEPRRYIHCVKMLDTHMPHPLLSDAARKWRGPSAPVLPTGPSSAAAADRVVDSQQTAGQPSKSREIPPPPERVPLPLQPRTLGPGEQKVDARPPMETEILRGDVDLLQSRFGALLGERERPKIELTKRTMPLELPPFEASANNKTYDIEAEIAERKARQDEKARRAKAAQEQKRRAMEEAFASDDEEEGGGGGGGDDRSSASEWEEPEALYQGSDSEE